jgi:N-acetylglucosamine-6-phosphate deacetylase
MLPAGAGGSGNICGKEIIMNQSQRLLIYNARVVTITGAWNPGWLLVEGRQIRLMAPGTPPDFPEGSLTARIDAGGDLLLPGFIDLHVHGAMGYELMDASLEGLRAMTSFYAIHGVTGVLPTSWTAGREDLQKLLEAAGEAMKDPNPQGAAILGVHMEGPFLNPARCGAQDKRFIRPATPEEALPYLETGIVRLITLAPEIEGNTWLISECQRRGVTVSAGHTSAGYDLLRDLAHRGVRQVTHCFNAMDGLNHRTPGTVGAAMSVPEISCELIADNVHIHPAVQKILIDVKTPASVILVTDGLRGAGLPEGDYDIGGRIVSFKTGAARLQDGTLAGSILTLDRALKHVVANTGRPVEALWPMSSLNAARAIGLSASKGSLEVGKDADLVLLDDDYHVRLTVVEGRVVFQSDLLSKSL